MDKIILASGSPRRRELLLQIGFDIEVMPCDIEEYTEKTLPDEVVMDLSYQKALATAQKISDERWILGADTVVTVDGEILGKPQDVSEAIQMIEKIQGRTHTVYTGVTLIHKKEQTQVHKSFAEATSVTVYPMTQEEILAYVNTKEPMDKAGAYGIQGLFARHIKEIQGDYTNVVGLPLGRVYQELLHFECQ